MHKIDPNSSLSHWQVAADGIWEEAYMLSPSPCIEATKELLVWLGAANQDIAIEAFFGDKSSDNFGFLGIRISSLSPEDQKDFIRDLVKTITPSEHFATFINKFQAYLSNFSIAPHSFDAFSQTPDFLELGVEGMWKSYGSYVIWSKGDVNAKSIGDIERNAGQLLRPSPRPIMMEHAYAAPMPMWLASPVSIKTNAGFVFDQEKYLSLIGASIS